MHETGCSGPVHWDDPEGCDGEGGEGHSGPVNWEASGRWDGEEGGRTVQDGGHMYTHG